MDGAFLETYVVTEIVKSYYNAGKFPDLYYYRDVDKKEIDLLLTAGQALIPIEIKKANLVVIVFVFPLPAPAKIKSGPSIC